MSKRALYRINKILLLSLLGLVLFISQAHSYTWVKLGDYENSTAWYEPTTIEKEEVVSSVLIKMYYPKNNQCTAAWMGIECEAKKYTLLCAPAVDENDKALDLDEGQTEDNIISASGFPAEHLYQLLCPELPKKQVQTQTESAAKLR